MGPFQLWYSMVPRSAPCTPGRWDPTKPSHHRSTAKKKKIPVRQHREPSAFHQRATWLRRDTKRAARLSVAAISQSVRGMRSLTPT